MKFSKRIIKKLIRESIIKLIVEQEINTSSAAAEQYLKDRKNIVKTIDPGPQRDKALSDLKQKMGVEKVEDVKEGDKVVRKKVIFKNIEPGPSHEIPAEFEEEK